MGLLRWVPNAPTSPSRQPAQGARIDLSAEKDLINRRRPNTPARPGLERPFDGLPLPQKAVFDEMLSATRGDALARVLARAAGLADAPHA